MKYVVRGNYIGGGSSVRTVNGVDAARHTARGMMLSGNFDVFSIIAFRMSDKKRLDISDITGVIDMDIDIPIDMEGQADLNSYIAHPWEVIA